MNKLDIERFIEHIFSPESDLTADEHWLWQYQYTHNAFLRRYCELLNTTERQFLPIEFFKHATQKTGTDWEAEAVFESSGTTGQQPSRHHVRDLSVYRKSALEGFFHFFPRKQYRICALLPSYLERKNASLVYMVRYWMEAFGLPGSDFYLNDFEALAVAIKEAKAQGIPLILIGVSFALLDFAEQFSVDFPEDAIIMETGGMKGRREESTREELHRRLKAKWQLPHIYSEYGMTEMLSQAYLGPDGRFRCPPWLRVEVRDMHLSSLSKGHGQIGRIHLIDMANVHSCSFIATDDIGRSYADGSFEVLGRIDYAEIRGCSLMYI